jgi:hypothetical protein
MMAFASTRGARGSRQRGQSQSLCLHGGRSHTRRVVPKLPIQRRRCASSSGGRLCCTCSDADWIDSRDYSSMTRHILTSYCSTLAPIPPLLAHCCWQTGARPAAPHTSFTRFYSAINHPLLISPRTLDPISFPPLVPTLFRVTKASLMEASLSTCFPLIPRSHSMISMSELKSC